MLRIIARLNVGGPSIQALTLTERLSALGYETSLVRGLEGRREGSMDHLARELGVHPHLMRALRRELGPRDLVALFQMTQLIRGVRPHIVHTHAAKAGALGRLACMLAGRPGDVVRIHTFHGHVLSEYFSRLVTGFFRGTERYLGRHTTKLIAVSEEVRDDLLRLRVAEPEQIVVVPLGFDLSHFDLREPERAEVRKRTRAELGLPSDGKVVVLVARLVAIKRVDRFLRIAIQLARETDASFVIVGDGELYDQLKNSPDARALGSRMVWAGIRTDMPALMAAADVVVLTSDNEGTPVSLIEAQAAGRPVVSTAVGGVSSVVMDDRTGYAVPKEDEGGFAERVKTLLADQSLRERLGREGRQIAFEHFDVDRLVRDIDLLYRRLLTGGRS